MCLNFPLPTNARALASCWALSVASKHRLKYFFLLLFRTKLKILCTHCCCLLFQTKLKTLCTHCCCHQTCMLAVLFSAWLNVTVMARSTVKYAALFDWVQGRTCRSSAGAGAIAQLAPYASATQQGPETEKSRRPLLARGDSTDWTVISGDLRQQHGALAGTATAALPFQVHLGNPSIKCDGKACAFFQGNCFGGDDPNASSSA